MDSLSRGPNAHVLHQDPRPFPSYCRTGVKPCADEANAFQARSSRRPRASQKAPAGSANRERAERQARHLARTRSRTWKWCVASQSAIRGRGDRFALVQRARGRARRRGAKATLSRRNEGGRGNGAARSVPYHGPGRRWPRVETGDRA